MTINFNSNNKTMSKAAIDRREDYKSKAGAPGLPRGRKQRVDNKQLAAAVKMPHRVVTRERKGRVTTGREGSQLHAAPACGLLDSQRVMRGGRSKGPAVEPPVATLDVSTWPAAEQARGRRWLAEAEAISERIRK